MRPYQHSEALLEHIDALHDAAWLNTDEGEQWFASFTTEIRKQLGIKMPVDLEI